MIPSARSVHEGCAERKGGSIHRRGMGLASSAGMEQVAPMTSRTIAALQIGSHPGGKAATLDAVLAFEGEIAGAGADLVVLPEALLGGYPKGAQFGTYLGYRTAEGREAFAAYHDEAVDLDGPEVAALAGLSSRTGAALVAGIVERSGASLFCTALFIEPDRGLVTKHRKLMPTGTERLIW